ncbi:CAP domain-containing protein [Candidatus Parabeggiatoa sp. HSG14]|uniref:CAP domain-containing protein n=1 Tax=Candidatus Parabeggiatoa sp. HSG14 TaxID=3055593 RepID=UPI0025A88196|nr:CAP domain-containing protein [Thiotrichales bacterium HSG14]
MSTGIWNYSYNLPGHLRMTVQVKAQRSTDDFNLYIYDPNGNEIAQDSSPDASAHCVFTTTSSGPYRIKLDRARGVGGFGIKIVPGELSPPPTPHRASTPRYTPPPTKPAPSQKQGSGLSPAERDEMLNAHNQWRQRYGVPPLKWSTRLADFAQEWAEYLAEKGFRLQHRAYGMSHYGENLAGANGRALTPTQVVDMWGNEVKDYDYATNTCRRVCGHYTQVVWRNTTEVGCGMVRIGRQEIWVCNYNPPGNFMGQKPY